MENNSKNKPFNAMQTFPNLLNYLPMHTHTNTNEIFLHSFPKKIWY
jgi:hypothetical protein